MIIVSKKYESLDKLLESEIVDESEVTNEAITGCIDASNTAKLNHIFNGIKNGYEIKFKFGEESKYCKLPTDIQTVDDLNEYMSKEFPNNFGTGENNRKPKAVNRILSKQECIPYEVKFNDSDVSVNIQSLLGDYLFDESKGEEPEKDKVYKFYHKTDDSNNIINIIAPYTVNDLIKEIEDQGFEDIDEADSKAHTAIKFKDKISGQLYILNWRITGKKPSGWSPSAEMMETVIAYAYNMNTSDSGNWRSKLNIPKNDEFIKYYEENYFEGSWLAKIVENIHKEAPGIKYLYKPGKDVDVTAEWEKFGGKEKTPKTDLCSDKGTYKFSLKKEGGSQLMSGSIGESKATVLCVLTNYLNSPDMKLEFRRKVVESLSTIIDSIEQEVDLDDLINRVAFKAADTDTPVDDKVYKDKNGNEIPAWIPRTKKNQIDKAAAKQAHKVLTDIITKVLDVDQVFKAAVIREAMSGDIKFGKNTISAANYMLIWDYDGTVKIKSIDKLSKSSNLINELDIKVNFKSSDDYTNTVLRIASKSGKFKGLLDEVDSAVSTIADKTVDSAEDQLNNTIEDNKDNENN